MHKPNPHGQLPAIAVPVKATGIKDIQHVAIILLETPLRCRYSPGHAERLGDQRRESFHQHSRNESDEHEEYVCVKGPNPGSEFFEVEPGRVFKIVEKIAQRLRRVPEDFVLLLNSGADEPVQFVGAQRGEFFHYRIEFGVADPGVLDVIVRKCLIVETGPGITLCIRRWYLYHLRAFPGVSPQAVQDTLYPGDHNSISIPRKFCQPFRVTGKPGSYPVAHRELAPDSLHVSDRRANNSAEQSHEVTWIRIFQAWSSEFDRTGIKVRFGTAVQQWGHRNAFGPPGGDHLRPGFRISDRYPNAATPELVGAFCESWESARGHIAAPVRRWAGPRPCRGTRRAARRCHGPGRVGRGRQPGLILPSRDRLAPCHRASPRRNEFPGKRGLEEAAGRQTRAPRCRAGGGAPERGRGARHSPGQGRRTKARRRGRGHGIGGCGGDRRDGQATVHSASGNLRRRRRPFAGCPGFG